MRKVFANNLKKEGRGERRMKWREKGFFFALLLSVFFTSYSLQNPNLHENLYIASHNITSENSYNETLHFFTFSFNFTSQQINLLDTINTTIIEESLCSPAVDPINHIIYTTIIKKGLITLNLPKKKFKQEVLSVPLRELKHDECFCELQYLSPSSLLGVTYAPNPIVPGGLFISFVHVNLTSSTVKVGNLLNVTSLLCGTITVNVKDDVAFVLTSEHYVYAQNFQTGEIIIQNNLISKTNSLINIQFPNEYGINPQSTLLLGIQLPNELVSFYAGDVPIKVDVLYTFIGIDFTFLNYFTLFQPHLDRFLVLVEDGPAGTYKMFVFGDLDVGGWIYLYSQFITLPDGLQIYSIA